MCISCVHSSILSVGLLYILVRDVVLMRASAQKYHCGSDDKSEVVHYRCKDEMAINLNCTR